MPAVTLIIHMHCVIFFDQRLLLYQLMYFHEFTSSHMNMYFVCFSFFSTTNKIKIP